MLRALSIVLGLLWLAGCDMVTIDKPIGEPFTAKEKASLVGSWIIEEGSISEVRKTKHGDLVIGSMSWDEKENKFKVETANIALTTIGQSKYVFIKSPEDQYAFCRFVRKDDANIELTLPDPKAFRKVVEESIAAAKDDGSKAIGSVESKKEDPANPFGDIEVEKANFSVKLSSESKSLQEFFESPKVDACFDTKAILKYKRIHK